jgi:SnoaL-like polyketide cyclase
LSTRVVADIVERVDSASELNKRKVRLFVEAVWNEGRLELIDELVAANYLGRVPRIERGIQGPEGVRWLVACGRRAHPDLYIKIEDQIAEDDRVAMRWRATTIAPSRGATTAPAGRTPCYVGISIVRLLAGKQVESHTECTDVSPGATSEPARDAEGSALGSRPAASSTAGG